MNQIKSIAFFFLLLFIKNATAQVHEAGSVPNPSKITLDSKSIIGIWQSTDSLKYYIEFIDSNYEIVLKSRNNHPYFFLKDSLNRVNPSGFFPNWPPFGCTLYLIAVDSLEIIYDQIGVPTQKLKFVKVSRK